MRFIRPVAYTFLILMWMVIIGGTVIAGSTINSTSGNNTAIEGGYTGGATTYESGSSSTTTSTSNSTSNIRSAPPTASAPGMNTSNNCAMSLSGGVQTFSIGVSGGKSYIDKNCELIVLSRTLQSFGMKVAAISLLCQDERVFQAMFMAKTYCPVEGKISQEAYDLIVNKYNYEMPTYKKYVELEKKKIIKPKKKPKELHTR
jgi:hypothetical protein